jgi:hypothetical protein
MEYSLFIWAHLIGSPPFYPRIETDTIYKVVCVSETPDGGQSVEVNSSPV